MEKELEVQTEHPEMLQFDVGVLPEFLAEILEELGLEGDVSVCIRDMRDEETDNPGLHIDGERAVITLHPNVVVGGFDEVYTLADAVHEMRHALGRLVLAGWFPANCPGMERWGPVVHQHQVDAVLRRERLAEAIAGVAV